jgi:DNA-binding PadR family transcriptional regulator
MSTRYAVLGLLIEQPDHGYQLTQRLQERLGAPDVRRSYVYELMKQLAGDELIRRAEEPASIEQGAPRVLYRATRKGVEHFEDWLADSPASGPLRDELHVKMMVSRPRDLPRLIELTWQEERQCLDRLLEIEGAAELPPGREAGDWPWAANVLVRNAEIAHLQTTVRWLQRARAVMERLYDAQGSA